MSEDTYTGQATDPLSLNLYTYCEGDPVNYTDPSGHVQQSDYTEFAKKPDVIHALEYLGNQWKNANDAEKTILHINADALRAQARVNGHYFDRTKQINNVLKTYAETVFSMVQDNKSIEDLYGDINAWYNLVKDKGDWDYKRNYSTTLPFMPCGVCMYNGKYITAEDFGNINFGYTGTALGFGPKSIFTGGAWAHYQSHNHTYATDPNGPYYGDYIDDHNNIQYGIDLFHKQWHANKPVYYFDADMRIWLTILKGR